jgi:acyl carrier protein
MTISSQDRILKHLTIIFREIFDDDDIVLTLESTADDIEEWDSLNQIKIILECEKFFQVKLKARDIRSLNNVGEMVDHLMRLRVY